MAHLSSMEPIMRYTSCAGTECFAIRRHRLVKPLSCCQGCTAQTQRPMLHLHACCSDCISVLTCLQGNGYSSLGARPSASAGLPSQPQHPQPPSAPQPQPSAFQQQANGHAFHAPQVGSAFSSGHSSGDLAQIPSPSPSQVRLILQPLLHLL